MFRNCKKMNYLDIRNFKTEKVTNMACLFQECNQLKDLLINEFKTENVRNTSHMFENCYNLYNFNFKKLQQGK